MKTLQICVCTVVLKPENYACPLKQLFKTELHSAPLIHRAQGQLLQGHLITDLYNKSSYKTKDAKESFKKVYPSQD